MQVATTDNWISSRAALKVRDSIKNWDEVINWHEEIIADDTQKALKYIIRTDTGVMYCKIIQNPNISWVGYNLRGKSCKSWCFIEQLEIFKDFCKELKKLKQD